VIMYDKQVPHGDLVEPDQGRYCLTRRVHECLGLRKQDPFPGIFSTRHKRLELQPVEKDIQANSQPVDQHETNIMAIVLMFPPWIAQTNDQVKFLCTFHEYRSLSSTANE